jgi:ATP-dependent Clp protease ATP-binding subunit ClpB
MNFHRFTIKAQEALQNAQEIAAKENHGEFKIVHLLAALLIDESSLVRPLLLKAGIDLEALNRRVEEILKKEPKIIGGGGLAQLYLSQDLI